MLLSEVTRQCYCKKRASCKVQGCRAGSGPGCSLEPPVLPVYRLQGALQVCNVIVPEPLHAGP